jgi:hypothetical protein
MTKDAFFPADPPSKGYITTMVCIALAGTLGLPLMILLVYTGIYSHKWGLVVAALFSGLICAGLLQSWKSARSAIRQRQDNKRHSITIAGQKFVYRKDDQVNEIPLADIVRIEDCVEPSIGTQSKSVKITYRKVDDVRSELVINAMDFSKNWEMQGKFGALLSETIRLNQG